MKELRVFGLFLLVILVLLATLMGLLAGNTTTVSADRSAMMEMWQEVSFYSIAPQSAVHGEDGPIQWQDPGMEAHIRFLLRKPEGEILKSEVWDIQVLDIQPNYHIAHDTMLTSLPEGWSAFTYAGVTGTTLFWEYYEGTAFPPLEKLDDLIHFDSLQILSIHLKPEEKTLTDLSGLAQRPNLKVLQLINCAPETLEPIASLTELTHLSLEQCGRLDPAPLADLPHLGCLSLYGTEVISLESLATLPRLSYLDLGRGMTYPSLEPLARSSVAYLNLSSLPGETAPDSMDLYPVAQIPGLIALGLSEHPGADTNLCREILAQCGQLRYLDIYGTPAAAHTDQLDSSTLVAFVYE